MSATLSTAGMSSAPVDPPVMAGPPIVTIVRPAAGSTGSEPKRARLDLRPVVADLQAKTGYALRMAGYGAGAVAKASFGIVRAVFGGLLRFLKRIFRRAGVPVAGVGKDDAASGGLPDSLEITGPKAEIAAEAAKISAQKYVEGVGELDLAAMADPLRAKGEVERFVNEMLKRDAELKKELDAVALAVSQLTHGASLLGGMSPRSIEDLAVSGADAGLVDSSGKLRELGLRRQRIEADLTSLRGQVIGLLEGIASGECDQGAKDYAAQKLEDIRALVLEGDTSMGDNRGMHETNSGETNSVQNFRTDFSPQVYDAKKEGASQRSSTSIEGVAQEEASLDEAVKPLSGFSRLVERSREMYPDDGDSDESQRPGFLREV